MHAVDLVTTPVIIVMIVGIIAFILIFRAIFRNKK